MITVRAGIVGLAVVCSFTGVAAAEDGAAEPPAAPVQDIVPDEPDVAPPPRPKPPPAPPPPAPPPQAPPPQAPAHTMDEVTVPRNDLRFGINFFGDTSFAVSPDSPHTSFALGALGIRLLGALSPALDALAEFAIETVSDGTIADVEQVAIRWRHGLGTLEVGRFHTDVGYWNTAYHHGLWLQPLIERPNAVRFEDGGGIVPVHWVGAQYMLQAAAGPGKLSVLLAVGNGRGFQVDDVLVLGDTNDGKSALLKVKYKAGGAELGVTAIYDVVAPETAMVRPALPGQRIHELVGNVYAVYRGNGLLAIAEGYAFRHLAGDQSWMTYAGFAVLGYSVTPWLMPYASIDTIRGANDDPFFTPDPAMSPPIDVLQVIAGMRFETSTWSALKLEGSLTTMSGEDNDYAGVLNWSFGL